MKLQRDYIAKPWGRTDVPGAPEGQRTGEIWFTGPADLPLLVKQIFTSERLSVQVHPNDAQAKARGLARGKTECWYILDCEPGAVLGLGFNRAMSKEELRAAALDGSIEESMHWRPVRSGDFFLVPAGTVHAIGAGIHLIEFQQNVDITYRLYDYGRTRELHLDQALEVADRKPYPDGLAQQVAADETRLIAENAHFALGHSAYDPHTSDFFADRRRWMMPLEGRANDAGPGECLLLEAGDRLDSSAARMLIGAEVAGG